jgi:hypothetical protein
VLQANGYKVKGLQKVDLSWSGGSGPFTVYRNGSVIRSNATSPMTDNINAKGSGSYTYKVCTGTTTTCSNEVPVIF